MINNKYFNMKKELSLKHLKLKCAEVANTILDISYQAHTGHIGSALSISDLVTVLYNIRLNVSKSNRRDGKNNNLRDRFILSKGHAGAALYAVLYQRDIINKQEIMSFGSDDNGLCEHPEITTPGVEMTSGSLGHGLAFGAGIALGLKMLNRKSIIDNRINKNYYDSRFTIHDSSPHVFVLISDGECGEGSVWEAAMFVSRMKLDNLTVIVDANGWQCFGKTSQITNLKPFSAKWRAFGFNVKIINGHAIKEIMSTYNQIPFSDGKPSVIIAKTVAGHGVPFLENKLIGHYQVMDEKQYQEAKQKINQDYL
jgi:transketolase